MFTAVIAVLSQLTIPLPSGVPLTLQTFAVALGGAVLGPVRGFTSVLVYILTGAVGAPVFTAFGAGPAVLFGKTGGFLWGFLFLAPACGFASRMINSTVQNKIFTGLCVVSGLLLCHLPGVLQFSALMEMPFAESALLVSVPYLLKDLLSIIFALILGKRIRRQIGNLY